MTKSTIWLDITEDDLRFGRRKDPIACPIALALSRSLGSDNRWAVYVDGNKWTAESPGHIRIAGLMPAKSRQFVTRWDKGYRDFEPGKLRLWLGT